MDILLVLEKLGFTGGGKEMPPSATSLGTYERLAEDWPAHASKYGESNLPEKSVFESTWAEILAEEEQQVIPEYQEKRLISGYSPVGDQLDMLYWDVCSGRFGDEAKNSQWFSHCSGVKADYPKPL